MGIIYAEHYLRHLAIVKEGKQMKGIIFGALLVGVAGSAIARPELNAFINKPANSIPELIAQIKSDKRVADRFMRHFSMSKEEVLEYVSTLHRHAQGIGLLHDL